MKTREQFEFQSSEIGKQDDTKQGRNRDTLRLLLEKQAHPEYDQIGVLVAYAWHVLPIRVNIDSMRLICVSTPTGEM